MSVASGKSEYKKQFYFVSIARQRFIEDTSILSFNSLMQIIKEGLEHGISIDFTDIFSHESLLPISKIELVSERNDGSICIKFTTIRRQKNPDLVFLSIKFIESANLFVAMQYSHGVLFSTATLKKAFEYILSDYCTAKCDAISYMISFSSIVQSRVNQDILSAIDMLSSYVEVDLNGYKQLKILTESEDSSAKPKLIGARYSENVYDHFTIRIQTLKSNEKKLAEIYQKLSQLVPRETVVFDRLNLPQAIVCEMISAALSHQMNWDFLRNAILLKTFENPHWIEAINLSQIKTREVSELFLKYEKQERVRAEDRAEVLRTLGTAFVELKRGFIDIYFDENDKPQSASDITAQLSTCSVFTEDPVEKKLQLLLQKISIYKGFEPVGNICKPTIDYHLVRGFLRREFLVPRTAYGREIISSDSIRKEQTMGAIRKHCADLITTISSLTGQSIATINNIEWWIGRTICEDENPLCKLETHNADWLRGCFVECPFRSFCRLDSATISAPNYSGNSY